VLESPVKGTSDIVSLMVERGGMQYLICSLKPDTQLQVNLDLYFDKGEKVAFFTKGHGKIHLSGYHIYDKNDPESNFSEKTSTTSPKKAVVVPTKKNAKKPESEEDSDDEDAFEELDESSEDSEEENKDLAKDSKKILNYKLLWSSLSQNDEEEEESDESDSDHEEDVSKKDKIVQDKKKIKKDTSTPAPGKNNGPTTQLKPAEVINLEEDDASASMNSSIGRTPMPKKKTPIVNKTNKSAQSMTPKKMNFAEASEESSDEDSGVKSSSLPVSPIKTKAMDTSSTLSASKKKKKKRKSKDALNTSNVSDNGANKSAKAGLSSATYSKTLSDGLAYEDIRVGNGPIAKKGKVVHVYYTGMLENNKVFDSREVGNKPFSFKLGTQQVISGWELGIEGMKVGGKRRLKVPAKLGYENKRMGPIPPNSTLYFNVELKAVS